MQGILEWPSISINNLMYRGSHIAKDIVEAICASLNNAPDTCGKYLDINI